jgi:ABC-2 type transport system permease protein
MKNPFRGFIAILLKEFTIIFRDRTTLFFMFFPPLMQIIAFGYALDNDVKHMPMMVLNQDRTTERRQLIDSFVNTQTFRVVGEVNSVSDLSAAIRRGDAYIGLEIPPDFTRRLNAGQTARVQVLIDGSSSTTALQALNTSVALALRQSLTTLLAQTGSKELPIEVRPQVLYNPAMRSPNFFVPGVIGLALQIATIFATSMSLVREKERGTIEQLLVSPVSRWGLMLGKVVPYLCISLMMALGLFLILRWVFFIPIQGSILALAVATFFYVFTLLSLGLLISTKAENIMQAFQMTMAILLPSVFFSGFIFPRETMPSIFYAISTMLPATYYIELMRAIILRGATVAEFWRHLAILAGMGVFFFSWCAFRYRRNLA